MKAYYSGKRQIREDIAGFLFISPWLIGFFAFAVIPIIMSLYFSFTNYDILAAPVFNGLDNFKRMMGDRQFWKALQVTFTYAFTAVPMRLVFAFFLASLFKRGTRMVRVYQAAYYLPSLVGGSIAVAVMWRRMFMADGLVNIFLRAVGINSTISWIGNADTALGVIIALAVWQFGSPMLIFLAGLRQIPKTYYEAASIDGAGWGSQFFHITLPQMTPIIFFNLIMQLINGFTAFNQAFIISGGRGEPQSSTLFYALYLYMRAFMYNAMGYGSALAWVLVVIIAFFTAIIFKTSDRWVHYES
jgi:multiple sugar transport system permease protein